MKTVQISQVRYINNDKVERPLFILDLANGQPSIVRDAKQFIIDLQNSYLIGKHVVNPNHPDVLNVLRDLTNFTVSGEITYAKQGELWTVTENSRVVTDRNHPKYNKVVVGQQLPYEKDMTLVTDGFLHVTLNPHVTMMNKQAQAYGMSLASMLNAFDNVPETVTGISNKSNTGANDPEDLSAIPDDILQQSIGTLSSDEPQGTEDAKPEKVANKK